MIQKTSTSTSFYIMPIISSSTLATVVGQDNKDMIINSIKYALWVITAFGCILFIKIL